MTGDQIKREHAAFCEYIQALKEYGCLLADTDEDFYFLLNVALKLDPDDKSGDSIHNFCLALAEALDRVRKSAHIEEQAEPRPKRISLKERILQADQEMKNERE